MKNILGKEIPEYIEGYGRVTPFEGAFKRSGVKVKREVKVNSVTPNDKKVLSSIEEVLDKVELIDGMTVSFHHHLRNGDYILNLVL